MRSLYILSIFLFVVGSLAVSFDDFQTQLDAMGSDDPKVTSTSIYRASNGIKQRYDATYSIADST